MKTIKLVNEDDQDVTLQTLKGELPGPFKVTAGPAPTWQSTVRAEPDNPNNWKYKRVPWTPKGYEQNVFVTLKQTESSGDAPAILKYIGYSSGFKKYGIVKIFTLAGHDVATAIKKVGYNGFKPAGLVFAFSPGTDQTEAIQKTMALVSDQLQRKKKENDKNAKWKAGAADRKKEASKAYADKWKAQRQALYDKFGKRNVDSVTARQIGGDDGYQWNVLINGVPMVNGLTLSEVPYWKRIAYQKLLDKNGKI